VRTKSTKDQGMTTVRPARPHQKFTPDGRRMREVLTYSRRGARFTPSQQQAWDAHHEAWWIPDDVVDDPAFELDAWFGRSAPLVVEIGPGVGEATAALAATRPGTNILAIEVWRPGVADTLGRLGAAGVDNVRLLSVDAVWSLTNLVPEAGLAGLWTFFPDPWPKKKHHKRRLVHPGFARLAAGRLAAGATWRLATDWSEYAAVMRDVLDAEPSLHGGVVPRWDERPVTRFERKGIEAGRTITDLAYERR
jgi:tRNA (guanine-N7-)-methyltransferase